MKRAEVLPPPGEGQFTWLITATSALRAAFGLVWAIDAYLKRQPGFAAH